MQRSHIASVYIYICIYIYPSHFNCEGQGAVASLRFLWSRARARTARAKCKEAIYTGKRDTASEESKAKERESDRLTKKRCIQGEFSGDK